MKFLKTIHPWQLGRIFRVRDWVYLLGIPCLALAPFIPETNLLIIFKVFLFGAVYLAWGYGFNNFFDCEEDNDSKNHFRQMQPTSAIVLLSLMTIAFISLGEQFGVFKETLLVIAINTAYSAPPIRLKRFLLSSLLANGFFFGMLYFVSAKILQKENFSEIIVLAALIFALFLPFQYVHFLEDNRAENSGLKIWERWGLAGLLIPLLLLVHFSGIHELFRMRILAISFSIFSLGLMFRSSSSQLLRVHLRHVGVVIGLWFLLERILLTTL